MNDTVKTFKYCPNYDEIVNFLYEKNDNISKLLITSYQDYIFSVKNKISRLSIDEIMKEYITKQNFYKFIQDYFYTNSNELFDSYDKVVMKLKRLYKIYEQEKIKKVNNARWL